MLRSIRFKTAPGPTRPTIRMWQSYRHLNGITTKNQPEIYPPPPASLPTNAFTNKLRDLYSQKLEPGGGLAEAIKPQPMHIGDTLKNTAYINEEQLFDHVISSIQEIENYLQLGAFIDQVKDSIHRFPGSCLLLLLQWQSGTTPSAANYARLHEAFESMMEFRQEQRSSNLYPEKLMKLYLYIFRFNRLSLNIMFLNLAWLKYGTIYLYDTYVLTYLLNLFHSGQKQPCMSQLVGYLRSQHGDTVDFLQSLPDAFIEYMLETQDFAKLHFVMSQFVANGVRMKDDMWMAVLLAGLQYSSYDIVDLVYKNYIMKDFPRGRFTIEDAVLNRATVGDKSVFHTLTDTLILEILHTISRNGDIESTEDLIKGHFIYKALSSENQALNKDLCIKMLESYCYHDTSSSDVDGDDSVKRILDLVNTFVHQANLSSVDVLECMNHKFRNWKADTRALNSKNEVALNENLDSDRAPLLRDDTNLHSSKYGVVLANLSSLNEFVNIHTRHMIREKFDGKTHTIFINCLLNHMVVFLNHTGLVAALRCLHHVYGENFMNYLDDVSWKLMTQSVSVSTSKKCARFYFDYMKKHGIQISPQQYAGFIRACLNGDYYYGYVTFYVKHYLKDYGKLNREMKRGLYVAVRDDSTLQELIAKLTRGENIKTTKTTPSISREYLKYYDERDLDTLQKIFP
ncbi:hypothetical protein Cantr_06593 [Candida viswanathii]|uniref:Uncharacterized protein n=1 Tax=Candida viswanathii TaxID=5486 RepID=A0A367XXE0_9ASCO|nr:hypothetical protein Cantr_06593 [Candida viswanathii]